MNLRSLTFLWLKSHLHKRSTSFIYFKNNNPFNNAKTDKTTTIIVAKIQKLSSTRYKNAITIYSYPHAVDKFVDN